jgi:hypothetical protein
VPRFFDNGSCFTVQLTAADVIQWAASWPCFGPRRALWFQFEKRSGDLVDMSSDKAEDNDPSGVLALSHDAQAWGAARVAGKPVAWAAELALKGREGAP